jgi:hypothetical protein
LKSFLAASWWKLFHRQIIFDGSHGVRTRTPESFSFSPFGLAPANISPVCTAMASPSSVPKPVLPSCSKRIHFAICDLSRCAKAASFRARPCAIVVPLSMSCNHALHHWVRGQCPL